MQTSKDVIKNKDLFEKVSAFFFPEISRFFEWLDQSKDNNCVLSAPTRTRCGSPHLIAGEGQVSANLWSKGQSIGCVLNRELGCDENNSGYFSARPVGPRFCWPADTINFYCFRTLRRFSNCFSSFKSNNFCLLNSFLFQILINNNVDFCRTRLVCVVDLLYTNNSWVFRSADQVSIIRHVIFHISTFLF